MLMSAAPAGDDARDFQSCAWSSYQRAQFHDRSGRRLLALGVPVSTRAAAGHSPPPSSRHWSRKSAVCVGPFIAYASARLFHAGSRLVALSFNLTVLLLGRSSFITVACRRRHRYRTSASTTLKSDRDAFHSALTPRASSGADSTNRYSLPVQPDRSRLRPPSPDRLRRFRPAPSSPPRIQRRRTNSAP